jgi:hypothetical protein
MQLGHEIRAQRPAPLAGIVGAGFVASLLPGGGCGALLSVAHGAFGRLPVAVGVGAVTVAGCAALVVAAVLRCRAAESSTKADSAADGRRPAGGHALCRAGQGFARNAASCGRSC